MTSSVEIDAYLKPRDPTFLGTFPSNQLPQEPPRRPFKLIANYCKAGTPGCHWVGMSFPVQGPGEFFSSFGLEPDEADRILRTHTDFREYLSDHSEQGESVHNPIDLQSLDGDECGEYSSYFILHGLPSRTNTAWQSILNLKRAEERDAEIKRLVPIRES
jgi:hypothetical protein